MEKRKHSTLRLLKLIDMMEYKTYLKVDKDKIEPTEALEKIQEIEGVDFETAF